MTAAQQKIFAQQKTEYEVNKIAGGAALLSVSSASKSAGSVDSSPLGSRNPSDDELEAEMNPPPKKAAGAKSKAKEAAPVAAVGKKSGVAAARKAAKKKGKKGKGSANVSEEDDDVVSVVTSKMADTKLSAAAQEKAKERAAADVLAKAKSSKQSSSESEDAADEESTPVKATAQGGKKKKKKQKRRVLSDESEEEEDSEDEHKPTDIALLSPTSAAVATAANYQRNFTLLAKLLDLESPMLTEKMTSFLLANGVLDVFTAFISRVPADEDAKMQQLKSVEDLKGALYHNVYEEGETKGPEYSELPLVPRARPNPDDAAEQTAVRRSYHVMQILCGQRQSQSLMAVLMPKLEQVTLRLMQTFTPQSSGNFFHACGVMSKCMTVYPDIVLQALCSPSVHYTCKSGCPAATCFLFLVQ